MSANRACSGDNDFCLESVVKGNNIEFHVLSSKTGWAAFGIGSSMADADVYVGWLNSGQPVVSRRRSTGHSEPLPNSKNNFAFSSLNGAESWVKLGLNISRPISSDVSITNSSRFIFAHSDDKPGLVSDPNSAFNYHGRSRGLLPAINFLGQGESETIYDNRNQILLAHGILFFLAWGVAPFVGIFVARYLKNVLGIWWYRIHVGSLLIGTGLLSLISFILIVMNNTSPHFDGKHPVLGLVVFICMFVQFILGFISNALWNPNRSGVPWWDIVHWNFGRGLFLLAIINIFLGIMEYGESVESSLIGVKIAYWVWISVGFTIMIAGQFYLGQQHHKEEEQEAQTSLDE